jgi:hypothetical protein
MTTMKKKLTFLCFGGGKNQSQLLKIAHKKKIRTYILENKKFKINKYFSHKINMSCYDLEKVKSSKNFFIKNFKGKNIEFIFRSSGPAVLALAYICKILNIKRVSKQLAYCVYSKSYFSNFLKKHKISTLKQVVLKQLKKINFPYATVIKEDAPIIGKKNIYLAKNFLQIKKNIFNKIKNNSHNKKVVVSEYIKGIDIGIFALVSRKNKKIRFFRPFCEKNYFKQNTIKHVGLFEFYDKKIITKVIYLAKKIINLYPTYYGFVSLTFRHTTDDQLIPYEINLGLSGDGYADKYLPKKEPKTNLYELEIRNLIL